ncbi:hypothetical protein ABKN59_007419 [Abortiporus biennis]
MKLPILSNTFTSIFVVIPSQFLIFNNFSAIDDIDSALEASQAAVRASTRWTFRTCCKPSIFQSFSTPHNLRGQRWDSDKGRRKSRDRVSSKTAHYELDYCREPCVVNVIHYAFAFRTSRKNTTNTVDQAYIPSHSTFIILRLFLFRQF